MSVIRILKEFIIDIDCIKESICDLEEELNEISEQLMKLKEGEKRNQKWIQFKEKQIEIHIAKKHLEVITEKLKRTILDASDN